MKNIFTGLIVGLSIEGMVLTTSLQLFQEIKSTISKQFEVLPIEITSTTGQQQFFTYLNPR